MDGKAVARIAVIVILAIAMTARAIHLVLDDGPVAAAPSPTIGAESPRTHPLRDTLRRCQELGEAATRDAECLSGWAENRRRFLGQPEGN